MYRPGNTNLAPAIHLRLELPVRVFARSPPAGNEVAEREPAGAHAARIEGDSPLQRGGLGPASAPDPSPQSIALEGRRIAEIVLRMLSRERGAQGGLFAPDTGALTSERADLAAPHLQLLLAHGRSAAVGQPIHSHDAMMILYAAMRAAERTRRSNP